MTSLSRSLQTILRINLDGTAVLVECGFLSNESECTKLKDGGYQTKLAAVIIASYLQYRQSLPQTGMVT